MSPDACFAAARSSWARPRARSPRYKRTRTSTADDAGAGSGEPGVGATGARSAPVVPGVKAAPAPRVEPAMPDTPDLVGSWAAYQRLLEGGIGSASLAELIAGVQSAPAAPAPGSPLAAAAAPAAVDVRALLYRGDRALQRAQELRAAAKRASGDELRALVDEVCDLVALALEPSP